MYLRCMPCTHLHDLWTNTCGLVGMARAFGTVGRSCMCNEVWKVWEGRQSIRTHYVERVRECERVFEPHRTRRYGRLSRWPCALFALLGAAALSRTHRLMCLSKHWRPKCSWVLLMKSICNRMCSFGRAPLSPTVDIYIIDVMKSRGKNLFSDWYNFGLQTSKV